VNGTPGNLTFAQAANGVKDYMNNNAPSPTVATLADGSITNSGPTQTQPHQNMMPSFVVNYIICLEGLYPDRP
jgi:microcystin-dependent protein